MDHAELRMSIKDVSDEGLEPLMPNHYFKSYHNEFNYLVHSCTVATKHVVVSIAISFDSSLAISITKHNEMEYWIHMYSLTTYLEVFSEKVTGDYIKLKEVAQNAEGNRFAIVYFDDGIFKLRSFTSERRSEKEIEENELDLNQLINISHLHSSRKDIR